MKKTVVIVGGGITGVYLCYRLMTTHKVILIEKRHNLGGRIHTVFDSKNNVLYEGGPWRINTNHRRVLKLLKSLQMPIKPLSSNLPSSIRAFAVKKKNATQQPLQRLKYTGLSTYDRNIYHKDLTYATDLDQKTGYSGIHDAFCRTHPYKEAGSFMVVPDGLSTMIERLTQLIKSSPYGRNVVMWTETMVMDIQRIGTKYMIDLDKPTKKQVECDKLIITSPPHTWSSWSIYQHLQPIAESVKTLSLHHIYAKTKSPVTVRNHQHFHIKTPSSLAQVISSAYNNNWFQISYTSGRLADFWYRLLLVSRNKWIQKLKSELQHVIPDSHPVRFIDFRSHYFLHAIHMWKPIFGSQMAQMVQKSIEPHPIYLPYTYVAGESFSSHQGWIEGSLETAEMVLQAMCYDPKRPTMGKPKYDHVIYDNRVVRVDAWKHRHPGSRQLIEQFLSKDITSLWKRIHNPESTNIMNSLQTGWYKNHKYYSLV